MDSNACFPTKERINMNLVKTDDLSYEVRRTLLCDVLSDRAVSDWMTEAEKNVHVQTLKLEVEQLNNRRNNEGWPWLPTHVFYLLDFDCERHARNKTEQKKWERLQVRASLALGVPRRESSLPWMVFQTLTKV